jgi:hypothetical protein
MPTVDRNIFAGNYIAFSPILPHLIAYSDHRISVVIVVA